MVVQKQSMNHTGSSTQQDHQLFRFFNFLMHLLELDFHIGAYNTFRVAKFSIW